MGKAPLVSVVRASRYHAGHSQSANARTVSRACWTKERNPVSDESLPIPKALYSCVHCREDYSWPAEDLRWSTKTKAWVCDLCWDTEAHGKPGPRLSDVLAERKETK